MKIPFNKPFMTGQELEYIKQAHANGMLAANGHFTRRCQALIEDLVGCQKAFLTHSATAALETCALLADIQPSDEVIMPSYTFVTTATAFVLRGAIPVFVDIREDTLNIDESKIEQAITSKTKAIVAVHYAGVGCEMDVIMDIAKRHNLIVIEDAAHGICASYKNRPLGSIGHLAALSFHETKNVIAGEGGALLVNDQRFVDRAEILLEKGTNRKQFEMGQVDKYTWVDIGSSYRPSELVAAFLLAQLEEAKNITQERIQLWQNYHYAIKVIEHKVDIKRPFVPDYCQHNAHMYYLLLKDKNIRDHFLKAMQALGILTIFHYIPLHQSEAGQKFARTSGSLANTERLSSCIARLPLWVGLEEDQPFVIEQTIRHLSQINEPASSTQ